jgi:hypothetical protein
MKRNKNRSVQKPVPISRVRAKGLNKGELAAKFNLLVTVLQEHDLLDKPMSFIIWMNQIPLSKIALKI